MAGWRSAARRASARRFPLPCRATCPFLHRPLSAPEPGSGTLHAAVRTTSLRDDRSAASQTSRAEHSLRATQTTRPRPPTAHPTAAMTATVASAVQPAATSRRPVGTVAGRSRRRSTGSSRCPARTARRRRDRRGAGSSSRWPLVVALIAASLGRPDRTGPVSDGSSDLDMATPTPSPRRLPHSVIRLSAEPPRRHPTSRRPSRAPPRRSARRSVTITVREGESTDPFSLPETGVGSGIIYDAAGWVADQSPRGVPTRPRSRSSCATAASSPAPSTASTR